MKVTALGEFGLIADVSRIVNRASPELIAGIGDDAAAWEPASTLEIATSDMLLEGIHFSLDTASWFDLGWKSVAVNLSDIAAMGGRPRYLLISIGLPPSTEVAAVEDFYRGAVALADQFGAEIAGGDTVRSSGPVVVSVTAIGAAATRLGQPRLLRRSAAKAGDVVAVTGSFGASAAGLEMLRTGADFPAETAAALRAAHLRPLPRVAEAQVLLAHGVEAAMDVSDGLAGDLAKLCAASGLSAVVDLARVPVAAAAARAFPERAQAMALYGGEDYELVFAAPGNIVAAAAAELRDAGFAAITTIGEIVAGDAGCVRVRDLRGDLAEALGGGYDAFAE